MPVQVTCPSCSRLFQAPDDAAGRRAKCPKCSCPIDIPIPIAAEVLEAEPQPVDPFVGNNNEVGPAAALSTPDNRKPCPMCGEMIEPSAIKCRFCGEVLDPAMAHVLSAGGNFRDPGWSRVRAGLATIYYSMLIVLIAIIAIVVTTIATGNMAGALRGQNPPVALITVIGIAAFVVLGAGLGMLIGQILCATVPASSGARGFAVGAIACLLFQVLLNTIGSALNIQAHAAVGRLLSLTSYILFIAFVRQSAAHLGNSALASSAGKLIIFGIILIVLLLVGGALLAIQGVQMPAAIVIVSAAVACLVWFVWFMRVLKQLKETIDGRMNIRSLIQEAGIAAMPR